MVTDITLQKDFDEALTHTGLVVVDFFAKWCGPCKMIAPHIETYSQTYTDVKFIKVDVDDHQTISKLYDVSSLPTIIFLRNGEVVEKVIGANPNKIKAAIDNCK